MNEVESTDKKCPRCNGGGWVNKDGSAFFSPTGIPFTSVDSEDSLTWGLDCPSCLGRGLSLEAARANATPGPWSIEFEACDCYNCSHGEWVYSINDVPMDQLSNEDMLYAVLLVNAMARGELT